MRLEERELLARMSMILKNFEEDIFQAGVPFIPMNHPLRLLKIVLYDLTQLICNEEKIKP